MPQEVRPCRESRFMAAVMREHVTALLRPPQMYRPVPFQRRVKGGNTAIDLYGSFHPSSSKTKDPLPRRPGVDMRTRIAI